MIVRDNEKTIRPCIESIRPWVDEMVVVDTGSKDRTPEILKEYGAKLSYFEWIDDFSAARNVSISHAKGEWIFWMDSDDTITAECGKRLRELADSDHASNTMGYVMQVHCPGPGENGLDEFTVVDHVKMFRNRPDLRFEGRIHEQVLMPIRAIGGDVEFTDIWIEHSGSDPSKESQKKKVERDLRILRKDLEERPGHPFVLFNFAMTYAEMGQFEEALDWVKKCLGASKPIESHIRKAFAYHVNCLFQLDRIDEALAASLHAREHYPDDAELLFREAIILHSVGRHDESIERYQTILNQEEANGFRSTDPSIRGYKCRFNVGLVYADVDQPEMSELQFRNVLTEVPAYSPAIKALGSCLIDNDRLTTAEVFAEQLMNSQESEIDGRLLLARVQENRLDKQAAEETLDQCFRIASDNRSVLEECCRFHFVNENWLEAKTFITHLLEFEGDNASAQHNLGSVLLQLDDPENAVAALEKSLELRPDSPATLQLLELATQNLVQPSVS